MKLKTKAPQSLLRKILSKLFIGVIEVPKFIFVIFIGIFLSLLFNLWILLLPSILISLFILEFDNESKELIQEIYEVNINETEEESTVGYWIYCQEDDKEIYPKVVPSEFIDLYFLAFSEKRPTVEEFNNWKKQILKK